MVYSAVYSYNFFKWQKLYLFLFLCGSKWTKLLKCKGNLSIFLVFFFVLKYWCRIYSLNKFHLCFKPLSTFFMMLHVSVSCHSLRYCFKVEVFNIYIVVNWIFTASTIMRFRETYVSRPTIFRGTSWWLNGQKRKRLHHSSVNCKLNTGNDDDDHATI